MIPETFQKIDWLFGSGEDFKRFAPYIYINNASILTNGSRWVDDAKLYSSNFLETINLPPLWSQLSQVSLLWCKSNHCFFTNRAQNILPCLLQKFYFLFINVNPLSLVKEQRTILTVASKAVHSGLSCPKFLCCGVNQVTVLYTNRAQNILPCLLQKFYFLFIKVNPLSFL